MEKIKSKTAVSRFLEQLPEGFDQHLTLDPKKRINSSFTDKFGESLIFDLPSGKKVKFIAKIVDPKKCKVWKGNIRLQEFLNEDNTKDLKEKILAQGQLVPILTRPLKEDSSYTHEIIYGSRRHFVCLSMDINIKILEAEIDDADALVFMDAENSGREDLSPYELSMAYKYWLENGIFKSQGELSEKLGISRSWLNKIISLSKIPKEMITALSGPKKLTLNDSLEIVKFLSNNTVHTDELIKKAQTLREEGRPIEEILSLLLLKQKNEKDINIWMHGSSSKIIYSKNGVAVCKITSSKQGKTILTFNSKYPKQELSNLLKELETFIKNSFN
jgi:ParB family chromosome partitioning protein